MIKDKIYADIIQAYKDKKDLVKSILGLLKGDIQNFEKEKGPIDDNNTISLINSMIKKIRETISTLEKYPERKDSLIKSQEELNILLSYLPKQLTVKEIENIVDKNITELGKDFRILVQKLTVELKGTVDNKILIDLIKQKTQ